MMKRSVVARWSWSLLVASAACGVDEAPVPSTEAGVSQSGVSAERLDVQDMVRQARLRFREDPQLGWVARQPIHEVSAADGVIRFKPRSWVDSLNRVSEGRELHIETTAITHGDRDLSLGLATTDIADDGMVRIDRGIAEERIKHTAEGIEQMWYFARAPAGDDDLTVRVSVQGLSYVGANADGHHFFDEVAQVGIRYSHATWIDFHGVATSIEVRFDGEVGELYMTLPAELIAKSSFPAVLDPTVSAERSTSGPAYAANTALEENPAIAFDGTNYLVVWSDIRDQTTFDIWGTFINANVGVLNNTGVPIALAAGNQRLPTVAFNGANYLVAWEDTRRGATLVDIMARIIDPAGNAVGGEITLSNSGVAARPDVAALNGDWYVVWEDQRTATNSNVLTRRINGAGVVDATVPLSGAPSFQVRPSIGCGTVNCLVAFEGQRFAHEDINRQRIDAAGLVDTVSATISGTDMGRSLAPDVAFDGTNYLVAWQDQRSVVSNDVWANRVSAATGAPLTPGGFLVSNAVSEQTGVTVSFDGASYLVAWQDQRAQATRGFDIFGTRILTNGTVVSPAGIALVDRPDEQTLPKLTRGNGQWMMVWSDNREGPPLNVRAMRVNAAGGSDRSGVNVALAANRQHAAAIAFSNAASNNLYLLVYSDTRGGGAGNSDIMGMRVNNQGTSFDPAGRAISTVAGNQVGVELSFNGTDFLVVWQDHRNGSTDTAVYGSRVAINNAGFTVREPNGILINNAANNQLAPTVAWNATANQWLVAYGDRRTSVNTDIYATRVAADGTVVDANGFALSTVVGVQERPDVVSDGTNWLVAWTDRRNGAALSDIYSTLVSPAGVPDVQRVVSGAALRQEGVRLAYNGTQYLAVWADGRLGTTNINVVGARINAATGVVIDGGGVNLANSGVINEGRPRVAAMGTNWFVAWTQSDAPGSLSADLYGRQFTSALAPVQAAFAISTTSGSEQQPAIAVLGVGTLNAIVAYQRYDDTPTIRSERVRYRNVVFP